MKTLAVVFRQYCAGWVRVVLIGLVLLVLNGNAGTSAVYRGPNPDHFMKEWLILKPVPIAREAGKTPTDDEQRQAFARDWLASVGGESCVRPTPGAKVTIVGKSFEWRTVTSETDTIDLRAGSDPGEFVVAYMYAEIDAKQPEKAMLGIGSDDGVKVWLNGNLVHENWAGRGVTPDEDLVPVVFERGKNFLVLKVQNGVGPWGFCCRVLSSQSQAQKLVTIIWNSGDVGSVQPLLELGLDINGRTKGGLTPWLAARLRGQTDMAEYLATKGADVNADMPNAGQVVNAMFNNMIHGVSPGAAVLVARNGKILFQAGYGFADIEHARPITTQTKFRIGSISKQFTAAAILKLQEQGKLSVDDKLSKYYPDYPRGGEVTLRHLLTHTSGIHNYTSKPGFMDNVTKPTEPDAVVESFKNDPFDFDPGKKWSYCNSGFFLLGCIVEKVSGQPYEDYLKKTFFDPLGMKNTGVHRSDAALQDVALGYDGGPKRAVNWDMSWAGGAGAIYSTVGDLFRWNEAVFHGRVLKAASLEAAFKPVKTAERQDNDAVAGYGFGWGIGKFRGGSEISHAGGLNGFTSDLVRLREKNLTVAVLANGAPDFSPQQVSHHVAEICVGTELEPRPKAVQVPAGALDLLVGRYDYGEAVLVVDREGTRLFSRLGLQDRFEIFPKSATEFFWKVADAKVRFVKGAEGKVVEAVHEQNGATIHAPRLPDLKIVEVDPSVFDTLVGKYKINGTDVVATITREGKRLFGQMPDQPKIEMLPASETEFGVREVNAQVTFVKDADGKVSGAKLVQSGRTMQAIKLKTDE